MAKLSVYFDGLCGFASRGAYIETYLFPHNHGQQLLIPTEAIDLVATTWQPERVGTIVEGGKVKQVGIWSLKGIEAVFSDGTGAPKWQHEERSIEFAREHPGAVTKSKAEIQRIDPHVGIVTLLGDQTIIEPQDPGSAPNFYLVKDGKKVPRAISEVLVWQTSSNTPTLTNASMNTRIQLRAPAGEDRWATISNVLPTAGGGLSHFHHYYDAVVLRPGDTPMTIERYNNTGGGSGARVFFADVYDCVPPVVLP